MTTRNPSNTPTQPAKSKWTWFELVGLIMAFGLIGWPVLNFAVSAVFPPKAQGADATSPFTVTQTASVTNAAPGEQFNYIFAIKATRTATLGRLTDVLPDGLNFVNSFCVPPNCDRVNNSEFNVDKKTLTYTGTSTAFQADDSVTLVLVVQLATGATGSVSNSAQICDTSLICATSDKVAVTVGGNSPTPRPASTTAPVPTATSVPPTATAAPPTATAIPATNTPSAPPTSTPIAAPTPTPAKATATPASAGGSGEAGTPSSEQGTVSAATATAEPATTAAVTTAAATATPTAGVIGGSFTAGAGASALSGNHVDLVLRGNGGEKVVTSSTIDGTGNYSFLDVPVNASGEVYYVKFTNTTGSKTLKSWSTTSFAFTGGQYTAPSADLSDISVGLPGAAGTSFALPLTLNWSKRASSDSYSITIFRADGTGVALASGDLGGTGSFTLKPGALPAGGYLAAINVTNANGTGVSQGQFIFKAGAAQAVTTAAVAAPTTVAAVAATTVAPTAAPPTPTRVPVPAGDKGEVEVAQTVPATSTATCTDTGSGSGTGTGGGDQSSCAPTPVPTVDTSIQATPVTDTPDLAPLVQVISLGVIGFINSTVDSGVPAALPPGTSSLPQSGGELPLAGLLLAAGVLGWRRYRLVARSKA